MPRSYQSDFAVNEKVKVDGQEIICVITAVMFRQTTPSYEVSWWHNGAINTVWVEHWRITSAKE